MARCAASRIAASPSELKRRAHSPDSLLGADSTMGTHYPLATSFKLWTTLCRPPPHGTTSVLFICCLDLFLLHDPFSFSQPGLGYTSKLSKWTQSILATKSATRNPVLSVFARLVQCRLQLLLFVFEWAESNGSNSYWAQGHYVQRTCRSSKVIFMT